MMSTLDRFKGELSSRLGGQDVYLYWKGRVGLYALLKAMGVREGDEVILPAFTCVVVPNAVIYLGAKPIYVDIAPDTFNMDICAIKQKISKKTKVIICQNTFGLSSELSELTELAKKHDLLTIEDCTHGFGSTYEGALSGTSCDAAFFSTQWNKPFSTGVGGFAILNNLVFKDRLEKVNSELKQPSKKKSFSLKVQLFLRDWILADKNYWYLLKLYRFLSANNLLTGSSSKEEITSILMPHDYFTKMGVTQAKRGVKALRSFDKVCKLRKENAIEYSRLLQEMGKNHVNENLFSNHGFLKYPLLVSDRDKFLHEAEKHEIQVGDWFISPIHPIIKDFHLWIFNPEDYPVALDISQKIINLPTGLKENKLNKVKKFLIENHYLLIDE